MADARQDLLNLLDRKAFDPIIKAKPEDYSEDDRKRTAEVISSRFSALDSPAK